MMRWMTNAVPAALVLSLLAVTSGQAPAPPGKAAPGKKAEEALPREELPRSLDEMLAAALRSNPEVLRAEARALQAQAALNQARLRVTEEVVSNRLEMQKLVGALQFAEAGLDGTRKRYETGTAGREELIQAEVPLLEARAKIGQAEARLRYLLGMGGDRALRAPEEKRPVGSAGSRARPAFSDKQREILERKVTLPKDANMVHVKPLLEEVTGELVVATKELEFLQVVPPKQGPEVTLRAFLTLVADSNATPIAFVFRDYGILITPRASAETMVAPALPEDTPLKAE